MAGHFDIVKFFVEQGIDNRLVGMTLHGPIKHGDMEAFKFLLSKNPDLQIEEQMRFFPFSGYRSTCLVDQAAKKGNLEMVRLLLEKGAEQPWDALSFAVSAKDRKLFDYLLEHSDTSNYHIKRNALEAAVKAGASEFVKELIQSEADLKGGMCDAIFAQQPKMVKLLISLGTDVNGFCNEAKISFLQRAIWKKNEEIVQILIENGADINVDEESKEYLRKILPTDQHL